MANFFPLIINPTGNIIQELPAADFLDLSQSGIANSGNITVSGVISATGNITGGNFVGTLNGSGANVSSLNASNLTSGTVASARLSGTYTITVSGSATTAGTVTTAAQPNITSVGTLSSLAVTGNTTSGNFVGTLNGSGANVTSISATNISSGTLAQARLANASLTVNGTAIALGGSATITAANPSALTIGSGLGGTSYNGSTGVTITNTGVLSLANGGGITASASSGAITLGSNATSTGVVNTLVSRDTSGNFSANIITATLNGGAATAATVTTAAQPNITSVGILTAMTTSSSVTVNNNNSQPTVIINGGTNGVGNIGSPAATFNTVFAKATTAQYADLAENYSADAEYEPGTVLIFGGTDEVTVSTKIADSRVVGVVTTNPAYLMNTGLTSDYPVSVALIGRVPVKVFGPVTKGDFMVSAPNGYAQACASPALGTVIGKAIQDFSGSTGVIEILINNQ